MKHNGGRKYGEGVYGTTYDFACKNDDNLTFCNMLKKKIITSIELHSFDKSITLEKKNEIIYFIKYIHNLDCCVAKVFKSYHIGFDKKGFNEEIKGMKTIYDIFGKETEKETTLTSLKLYNFNFIAAYINFDDDSSIYSTFTSKCDSDLFHTELDDLKYKKFTKEILHTLHIIQTKDFAHCDIKPDNIIYCKKIDRFKMIDWGLSGFLKPGIKMGATMFSSPLVKYLGGFPAFIAVRLMYYSVWKAKGKWFNSSIFKEIYKIVYDEFYEVIKNKSDEELYEKYKYKFDLFNFGMCLAYLVFVNGLSWPKYKKFIMKLISMKGYLNAEEAYKYIAKV